MAKDENAGAGQGVGEAAPKAKPRSSDANGHFVVKCVRGNNMAWHKEFDGAIPAAIVPEDVQKGDVLHVNVTVA